jgi:hypothetical protein
MVNSTTNSLIVGTSTLFSFSLSGNTNNVVTWQVNGIAHGNDTVGTIDSQGKYIAPGSVPSPAVVNVGAVPSEDSKLSTTLAITILPAPVVTITSPTKPVPPAVLTVTSGSANTMQFKASVTGAPTNNIFWYVGAVGSSGVLGGNATFGTIDATGLYTAPLTPPIGSTVSVIAQSADFPPSEDRDTVMISGFSTSSFQGNFAFSMAGTNASGRFFRAGSFFADGDPNHTGTGNLQGGLEDINDASGPTTAPISFVGTYTIGVDGRGTMQFSDGRTPAKFSFVLVNASQLQIIGFDNSGTATGQADLQDLSTFDASALNGTHVFDFSGVDNSTNPLSQIGEFTTDGKSQITTGILDINDNGVITSKVSVTGGSYAVTNSANGRGTATLFTSSGNMQFGFYIVSRGLAKFVGLDTTPRLVGPAFQQDPNATFGTTSLFGNYAFLLSGFGPGGKIATAGSFSADGNGNLTTGVVDENVNGTSNPDLPFLSAGTYTVGTNGRGTETFKTSSRTYTIVFYLSASGNAVLQETDSGIASDGNFALQQSAAFSLASIQGNYTINSSGLSGASAQDIVGQLPADGAGTIPSGATPPGTIDINTTGATKIETVSGTYTAPASNGRSTMQLNPSTDNRNFAVYIVNSNQAFILGIDPAPTSRLAAGSLLKQF